MNACSNQKNHIWVTAVVLPPTRVFILSSQVFVFQTGKMTHPATKDPHLTHTHGPHNTLNLPPSNVSKSLAWQMKNLLSFFQAHTPTRNMKVIRIREIRSKGEDWRRGMKEEQRRRIDHFRACALWGITLQMTRAMDQFCPPPLWLSSQAEHTTIWLLTTHSDHKTQLIQSAHTHTVCVHSYTHSWPGLLSCATLVLISPCILNTLCKWQYWNIDINVESSAQSTEHVDYHKKIISACATNLGYVEALTLKVNWGQSINLKL